MTTAHQWLAVGQVVVTVALVVAAAWSLVAGRVSSGARDHRVAVDRLILIVILSVTIGGFAGGALLVGGRRPSDVLHLVYGLAAFVTLPAGYLLAGRGRDPTAAAGPPSRSRRDAWILLASIVLVGIEYRSFVTG